MSVLRSIYLVLCSLLLSGPVFSQDVTPSSTGKRRHAWYVSWGYNAETYTRSDIHVKQSTLGNDYTLNDVESHDHKGWDDRFLHQELTIPQYNYRIGYMLDDERGIGIELNFDHTKHVISDGQSIRLSGKLGDHTGDTTILFSEANGFYYYLNNGANFFLINLVKRWNVCQFRNGKFRLDALGKAGIGPVVPHVQNSFFGKENDPGFQFGGWNVGVEGDIKATFFRYVFLEYGMKVDYARYSNLKIYEGTAREAFGTFEMILSLGLQIPMRKS